MLQIILKKSEDRRVRAGHLWVFSNEIDRIEGGVAEPGVAAEIRAASGRLLGTGYYNPKSLIACRIVTREKRPLDAAFLAERLKACLELRERWYPGEEAYRLAFSEGDGLPGFLIDRFGELLVVQSTTAGAERLTPPMLEALDAVLAPRAVVLRNDAPVRELEGLQRSVSVPRGAVEGPIEIRCDGVSHSVDVLAGQKTGFYFDQRDNRRVAAQLAPERRVLDLHCHSGAFALAMARAGATKVTAVDTSEPALELARRDARANGLLDRLELLRLDAQDVLGRLRSDGTSFDVVLLDPPPLARTKKALRAALQAYERLNRMAMEVLSPGGYLLTSTCSHHVSQEEFGRALARAAAASQLEMRLIEWRGQSRDHPSVLAMPETRYLKMAVLQGFR